MTKKERIVSYTAEELQAMRARGEDRTDWEKVDALAKTEVHDDDEPIQLDWSKAKLVVPANKQHINLRVDADVLQFFKQGGKGYQTRMNAVLRTYMMAQANQQNDEA